MKLKYVLIAVLFSLGFLSARSAKALPGQRLSDLDLNQYSNLTEERAIRLTSYQGSVADELLTLYSTRQYRTSGQPVEAASPDIHLWVNRNNTIFFESLASGSSGASVSRRLLESDYNPREDQAVISLASSVWGEAIVQDFVNSRFTDAFIYQLPRTEGFDSRRLYVGNEYIHEIIGGSADNSTTGFLYNLYSAQESILSDLQELEQFERRQ